jgi:hypothetical protein
VSKKHTEKNACNPNVIPKGEKCNPNVIPSNPCVSHEDSAKEFVCKYCNQTFKYRQSVSKHIKYSCKKNKDEDLKELVRLLNLQLQQKDNHIKNQDNQIKKQQKQIDKLMDKLQVPHITTNQMNQTTNHTTNNIQNNIKLLCYKDTDISHLTEKDYSSAIRKVNSCVKHIIECIHYNPSKPENHNIYISNRKDKYIMVYESGNWNIKHKNDEVDTLYENNEMLLEDWLDEYGTDALRDKFRKYLTNKEDPETFKQIKENIHMMMYNKGKR